VSAIPTIPPGTGIVEAAKMKSCTVKPGKVKATGTITLPKGQKAAPVISVSWVNPANSSVYTRAVTTVNKAKPGKKTDWSVTATLPGDAAQVSCVLGAVIPS
jgi:hypothetical protein